MLAILRNEGIYGIVNGTIKVADENAQKSG